MPITGPLNNYLAFNDETGRLEGSFQIKMKDTNEFQTINVKQYTTKEIFCKPGQSAFTHVAQTGGGKTVICADIVKTALENGYNNITYITRTYSSKLNTYLKQYVARFLVYEPVDSTDFVKYVHSIVKSLRREMQIAEQDIEKVAMKIAGDTTVRQIKSTQNSQTFQQIVSNCDYKSLVDIVYTSDCTGRKIFEKIWSSSTYEDFTGSYNQNKPELLRQIQNRDFKVSYNGQEMSKYEAYHSFVNEVDRILTNNTNTIESMFKDIIIQEFKRIRREEPEKIKLYYKNRADFTGDELFQSICEISSNPFKPCVIMDDVSSFLDDIQQNNQEIILEDVGKTTTQKQFKQDLAEIYTRGRHFGGIIFVSMHNVDNLDHKTAKNVSNFILHQTGFSSFANSRTILAQQDQTILKALMKAIVNYNKDQYRYNIIHFNDVSQSPDGQSHFAFYQAEFAPLSQFSKQLYQKNPYFKMLLEQTMQQ